MEKKKIPWIWGDVSVVFQGKCLENGIVNTKSS